MKNILFVLRNHFVNDSRVLKEATTLTQNGLNVTVRCLWDEGLLKKDLSQEFIVERVCYSNRKCKSKFRKIITFLKFIPKSIKNIKSFDVVHGHDLDGLIIAVIAKAISFGKTKIVYDAHEYEAERVGLSSFQKKIFYLIEFIFIKFADEVICVSESIANEYVKNYKINKPKLILNCPSFNDDTNTYNYFREKFNLSSDHIIFLYQGLLGPNRGVNLLIDAFMSVEDKNKVLIFMGYGSLYEKVSIASSKSDNIFLHEAVSPEVLLKHTASADVGMVLIENACLSYYYCLPNKFFEYSQANLPVIVSNLPELTKITKKYETGLVVEENKKSIVAAVNGISKSDINKFKENIPKLKNDYNWGLQEDVLLSLYKNLF